jgi:hypothetical protein
MMPLVLRGVQFNPRSLLWKTVRTVELREQKLSAKTVRMFSARTVSKMDYVQCAVGIVQST